MRLCTFVAEGGGEADRHWHRRSRFCRYGRRDDSTEFSSRLEWQTFGGGSERTLSRSDSDRQQYQVPGDGVRNAVAGDEAEDVCLFVHLPRSGLSHHVQRSGSIRRRCRRRRTGTDDPPVCRSQWRKKICDRGPERKRDCGPERKRDCRSEKNRDRRSDCFGVGAF